MNELIEELYKQSFIEVQDENSFPCMTFSKQKFAELIVGECFYCVEIMEKIAHASNADIPPDYDRQTYLKTLEAVTGLLKTHFGVEE
jgi:hypothetical protein